MTPTPLSLGCLLRSRPQPGALAWHGIVWLCWAAFSPMNVTEIKNNPSLEAVSREGSRVKLLSCS